MNASVRGPMMVFLMPCLTQVVNGRFNIYSSRSKLSFVVFLVRWTRLDSLSILKICVRLPRTLVGHSGYLKEKLLYKKFSLLPSIIAIQ